MQKINLEEVRKEARRAVKDFLHGRDSAAWRKLAPTLYVKRDGAGLNLWVRGDHACGEGFFFLPAYELPALAEVLKCLSEEFIERYKGEFEPGLSEISASEIKKLEKPGKVQVSG